MSLLRSSLEGSLAARFQANGPSLFLEELFVGSASNRVLRTRNIRSLMLC